MKILSGKKTFAILGILGTLLLCIAAIYFIACTAGGPEPGGNCAPLPEGLSYQYEAPPYSGNATVILGTDDHLYIYASGERFGQAECTATIDDPFDPGQPVQWLEYDPDETGIEFPDLRPNHIRGACLDDLVEIVGCSQAVELMDLLAVSNMAFGDSYESDNIVLDEQPFFDAQVLLMQLQ